MMLFGVGIEPMTSMRRKPPSEVVVEGLKGFNRVETERAEGEKEERPSPD